MPSTYRVYVEVGRHRMFAGALDWPGWCRSGRDEEAALEALVAYGGRYQAALGRARRGFAAPTRRSQLRVVERLPGNATTDFGAPGIAPSADGRPLDRDEIDRQTALLRACWSKFDRAARAASGAVLRKGPRGGGRELDAIVRHVMEADGAYLARLGGTAVKVDGVGVAAGMKAVRGAIIGSVRALARGEPPARTPRSGTLWSPRYGVRRSAWHALDHAWEIEDRAESPA